MALSEYWSRTFGDTLPLTHLLRDMHATRWVRFHSMADSKRYPETEAEYAELLERHNAIISELAPERGTLHLVTTSWSPEPEPNGPVEEIAALGLSAIFWRSISLHDPGDEVDCPSFAHLYASTIIWQTHSMDSVFLLAAENRISNLMLLDIRSSWMVHPYDGGIDVVLESSQKRDTLAHKFPSWVSPRADGL